MGSSPLLRSARRSSAVLLRTDLGGDQSAALTFLTTAFMPKAARLLAAHTALPTRHSGLAHSCWADCSTEKCLSIACETCEQEPLNLLASPGHAQLLGTRPWPC